MESQGSKRGAATVIGTILNFVFALFPWLPGLGPLSIANGVLGAAGLAHASYARTLMGNVTNTIGAALTVLYGVALYVPILQPYAPIIAALINVFGGASIAKSLIGLPVKSDESKTE